MPLATYQPTFLYPISRGYPFDEVFSTIVQELEARNWNVPGITVTFHVYGTGEQKYRCVDTIEHEEFLLKSGRGQRHLPGGRWIDTAAIHTISIPGIEIDVYEDGSGPTFFKYVGHNWERDREKFRGLKVISKYYKEPRIYLRYEGRERDGYSSSGNRHSMLYHTNDLGREYNPHRWEPRTYDTKSVFREFTEYLTNTVLPLITKHPIPMYTYDDDITPIPMPEIRGTIFTYGNYEDLERIQQGQRDPASLEPAERYAFQGAGYRLVPIGNGDATVPAIAYDGFLWCKLGEIPTTLSEKSSEIPGHSRRRDERVLIKIKPTHGAGIYIADMAAREDFKSEYFTKHPEKRSVEGDAVNEIYRAPGRTIIPITEYTGTFRDPVVLINREIDFDEVEILGVLTE